MDVTVCICTHNRPSYLRDCLEGLCRQAADPECFNMVVVDSASHRDALAQIARLVAAAVPNSHWCSVVRHQIQATRLMRRLGRLLAVWRELPRKLSVAAGFVRAALGPKLPA